MSEHLHIPGVSERDLDLLLVEEFIASSDFCAWFLSQIGSNALSHVKLASVKKSVTDTTGESDVEARFEDEQGAALVLLIENKINAGFQPQQAERYQIRGKKYSGRGDKITTVLVAPSRYFGDADALKGFDARVTHEAIRDWFAQNAKLGERRVYKQKLLDNAITKGTLGYNPIEDEPVTTFWSRYWKLAEEYAPELQMKKPSGKPADAGFIYFRAAQMSRKIVIAESSITVDIVHKLPHGNVDLQFSGMGERLDELKSLYGTCMDHDMEIVKAAKSGSIRLKVPGLNANGNFEEQSACVVEGILASKRLLAWYKDCSPLDGG